MILGLFLILACQLVGEVVAKATHLPVPGPVLGMALLFGLLLLRARHPAVDRLTGGAALPDAGKGLLRHLSLLLVPAGVGVVQRLDLLAAHGIGLGLVIVVSTVVTLLVTVAAFRLASRLLGAEDEEAA